MAFQASWLQRQLGRELLALRESRGHTTREVGEALGWAHTKVGRVERAENKIDPVDVIRLAKFYKLDDADTERLCAMARQSRTDIWWEKYKPWLSDPYYTLIGYENDATRLYALHNSVVHGLLQTERYMRAMYETSALIRDPDHVDMHIEVRLQRQRRLFEPEPLLADVILDESVLGAPYGGAKVLGEQLKHLRELSELPNVSIRAVSATAAVARMPLDIYEFGGADGPAVAMSETLYSTIIHDGPLEVRQARRALEFVQAAAMSPQETVRVIENRIREIN
ncbi:MAG TPA: helix-turn-helix transcriptional regulator [Actinocrinis sp.]|uniref:helix-turn-helix domain-containing protein n=1 Tax=Actinocrinis sp. TaxID=1920516 RepID=UPI002DDD1AC4|nr:helix-turn-helix transcriptional regulator [Actinocrinis sp.]HEV2347252.1 helix-turn-helix transcriptional regulator [Actinocrinis sp.]